MIRYIAAAVGLKAFSLNRTTRSLYRSVGNVVGQRKRKQQDIEKYVERGDLLVKLSREYGVLTENAALLELGTGWIHWFGLYLRLQIDEVARLDLFDVWDNRQLDALKNSFYALQARWQADASVSNAQRERLAGILQAESFDELYAQTGAYYKIDDKGSLASYPVEAFDLIFSFHVLEHVGRDAIHDSILHMYRMLKPGGYCIHQIGIDDHLAHYDSTQSKKTYLKYSLALRKRIFENVVQYHNVLQGADYQRLFAETGFEIVKTDREKCDIESLSIHPDWSGYSKDDLATTIFTVICKKPV